MWRHAQGEIEPWTGGASLAPRLVFPGSFNPLHEGHRALAAAAAAKLPEGGPVLFELTVHNADKGSLPVETVLARVAQFTTADVLLTRAPLFLDKARLVPGACFVVGYDTAARLLDPKYYDPAAGGLEGMLSELRRLRASFLVAGRLAEPGPGRGRFMTADSLPVSAGFEDLFRGLSEAEYRADVSSTQLRNAAAATASPL